VALHGLPAEQFRLVQLIQSQIQNEYKSYYHRRHMEDPRLAEPDHVQRSHRDRPVDPEHRDLERVAGLHRIRQHHAIGQVEALNRGRARIAATARHLPVHPDFRVIVDEHPKHRLGSRGVEIADLRRNRDPRAIPDEADASAAAPDRDEARRRFGPGRPESQANGTADDRARHLAGYHGGDPRAADVEPRRRSPAR